MTRERILDLLLDDDVKTIVQHAIQGRPEEIDAMLREADLYRCDYETLENLAVGRGLLDPSEVRGPPDVSGCFQADDEDTP